MIIDDLSQYIPKNEYSYMVKEYFSPMKKNGTAKYIANIDVQIQCIEIDEYLVPLVFGNSSRQCYTVSFSGIFRYGIDEVSKNTYYILQLLYKIFLYILATVATRVNADNIVYINNFMVSTNLYPDFSCDTVKNIHEFVKGKYPDKVIIRRSLNNHSNASILESLISLDYKKFCGRQIFIFEKRKLSEYKKIRKVRKDIALTRKYSYTISHPGIVDSRAVLKLYTMLYIQKYNTKNPQFTQEYIKYLSKSRFFRRTILSDKKKYIAVAGYFSVNGVNTTPILGYDMSYAIHKRLYAQITTITHMHVLQTVPTYNASSGAGLFKKRRGGEMVLEYSCIYVPSSLHIATRVFYAIVVFLSKTIIERELSTTVY